MPPNASMGSGLRPCAHTTRPPRGYAFRREFQKKVRAYGLRP